MMALLLVNPCIWHRNNGTMHPTYVFIICILLQAMFDPLHSSMNQQLYERVFAIKVATMKITGYFC